MAIGLITGRCSSDRVFLSTFILLRCRDCLCICMFFSFFSLLFAALVANKVITIGESTTFDVDTDIDNPIAKEQN